MGPRRRADPRDPAAAALFDDSSAFGPRTPAGLWRGLLATASYLALSVASTWPLVLHFGDAAPGAHRWGAHRLIFDTPLALWDLWWFRHAIAVLHQSPFSCSYLFYPWGADLRLHTLAPLHGAIALGLQPAIGLAATHNVLVLANLVAAGLVVWKLGRWLGASSGAAFLAGVVYAFSPPVMAHLRLGHLELLSTVWLPAALLLFLELLSRPERYLRWAILLGLVGTAAYATSPYYAVYAVELLVVAALALPRRLLDRRVLAGLGLAAVIAGAATFPALRAFFGSEASGPAGEGATSDFSRHSGDLLAVVVPPFHHPLWHGRPNYVLERLHVLRDEHGPGSEAEPQETTLYAGLSVLVLAAIGLRRLRGGDTGRLLGAVALVFWLLALGSRLKILGTVTALPLPAALLERLPVLQQARAPGRHMVVAALALGLLAAFGWQATRSHWARALFIAALAIDYSALPVPLWSTALSPAYHRLAQVRGSALLEIPFGARDGMYQVGRTLGNETFAQTEHHLPLVGGVVSRLPSRTWRALLAAPVIGTLASPTAPTAEVFARDGRDGPPFFAHWRIRTILVHAAAVGSPQHRYLESVLPVARSERVTDGSLILTLAGAGGGLARSP